MKSENDPPPLRGQPAERARTGMTKSAGQPGREPPAPAAVPPGEMLPAVRDLAEQLRRLNEQLPATIAGLQRALEERPAGEKEEGERPRARRVVVSPALALTVLYFLGAVAGLILLWFMGNGGGR